MKKILFLLATAFILIFWQALHLPFEIPDEQSHFATVNFLVDQGRIQGEKEYDLSREQEQVEYIFGVMTDGTNKYAHNPGHRIDYSEEASAKNEELIKSLNTPDNRSTYTLHQGAVYPPLYYYLTGHFYRLNYGSDIISRLYTSRFFSTFLVIATIYVYFLIGRLIWSSTQMGYFFASLALFYPMTTYIGAGVNPDNLHNLLFSFFVYVCIRVVKGGLTYIDTFNLAVLLVLDLLTKPQAYIMIPLTVVAILLSNSKLSLRVALKSGLLYFAVLLIGAGWHEIPKFYSGNPYIADSSATSISGISLLSYLKMIFHKFTSELVVWYWGVFKWTTIIVPRLWWWSGIRLILLSILGLVYLSYRALRSKHFEFIHKVIIFAVVANSIYVAALVYYDWNYYHLSGRSLGFQARYFMPLLSAQLILIVEGVRAFTTKVHLGKLLLGLIFTYFFTLQLVAVFTVASSYYETSNITSFIAQASRYKPPYFQSDFWYLWLGLYLVSMIYVATLIIIQISRVKLSSKKG